MTTSIEWFLRGFTARDIADPLLSVDECSGVAEANRVVKETRVQVLAVRRQGLAHTWIRADDLSSHPTLLNAREFSPDVVIEHYASLNEVVAGLRTNDYLFMRDVGHIVGVLSRRSIEKPPMRMWLFGIVTVSEQRVTQLIAEVNSSGGWERHLSSGRMAKAQELQQMRLDRGQQRSLLDCLQLADKGQIIARDEMLRSRTRFESRKQVESFVQSLQDLRNNLAHAQEISENMEVICELAENVHRIIAGPSKP
jgi:hypothetical protein